MASVADYSAALSGNQLERDAAGHRRGTVGCLDFAITADLIDPGRVNIFERWESHGAVEAFRGGGPGDDQGAAIVSASVAEYDIAEVWPLLGEGTG